MRILKNCWYAAAWSHEIVEGQLFPIKIAGESIVFYRKEDGGIAAIADYCPHRFAPLHLGKICGNVVQCGYHGLQFDENGKCVRNPHEKGNLPAVTIPSYAACEKHSVIWIWVGEKEKADPALIHDDLAFLDSPDRGHARGRFHVKGNYQLLLDNLFDLSHALYLHGDALMTEELYAKFDPKMVVEGDQIKVTMELKDITAPGFFRIGLPEGSDRVDFYDTVKYLKPSMTLHDIAYTQLGKEPYRKDGASSCSAHLFTPETESTSHYLFDNSRDFLIDDEKTSAGALAALKKAFGEEDIPMIEAQQKIIGDRELFDLKPSILVTDRTGVMVRRMIAKWIREQEAAEAASCADAATAG